MNITEEKQAIRNARKIYLLVNGVRATLTKRAANELLFERQGYVIADVFTTHINIQHVDDCHH
jgi:hypothetical protein